VTPKPAAAPDRVPPVAALDRIGSPVGRALTPLVSAGAALNPLFLPRLLIQAAADIQSIAASTRTLTVAVAQLEAINARVDSLDDEVRRMRAAVEAIGTDVEGMQEHIAPLGGMAARLSRLSVRRRGAPPAP
jgi:outer membrane murein-binding lipoprotein Lpp